MCRKEADRLAVGRNRQVSEQDLSETVSARVALRDSKNPLYVNVGQSPQEAVLRCSQDEQRVDRRIRGRLTGNVLGSGPSGDRPV